MLFFGLFCYFSILFSVAPSPTWKRLNSAIFGSFFCWPLWKRLNSAIFGIFLLFFSLFSVATPGNFSTDALGGNHHWWFLRWPNTTVVKRWSIGRLTIFFVYDAAIATMNTN